VAVLIGPADMGGAAPITRLVILGIGVQPLAAVDSEPAYGPASRIVEPTGSIPRDPGGALAVILSGVIQGSDRQKGLT